MSSSNGEAAGLHWQLLYTRARAESWAEANLRKQGFAVLLPRIAVRQGFAPLFPRYVFAGTASGQSDRPLRGTFGVLYVVQFGNRAARVHQDVIDEVRARMDARGVVELVAGTADADRLFARKQRDRMAVLAKFAEAGFRVKIA